MCKCPTCGEEMQYLGVIQSFGDDDLERYKTECRNEDCSKPMRKITTVCPTCEDSWENWEEI